MPTDHSLLENYQCDKTSRGLARLLSSPPVFGLHPTDCIHRRQVEQYAFDQFQASHGASISNFMPLLLSMSCHGKYTATAGIRSAGGQDLFLEQYLPEPIEKVLGSRAGKRLERIQIAEIGNLVATRRGSSQLLFLVMSVILQQAGFDWLVFTATPQVYKTINRLGFELFDLGAADPAMLGEDNPGDWGSYYESKPRIVTGSLSGVRDVLAGRRVYTRLISHYQNHIDGLSSMIRQHRFRDEQYSFAA